MLADQTVAPFFANTDMTKQKTAQKNFIGMVTGGPANYTGQDMKTAHEKMKITDKEFNATWENLLKLLNDHKVPENLINELKEIVVSTHDDIVNSK
jgi:hemoglobin